MYWGINVPGSRLDKIRFATNRGSEDHGAISDIMSEKPFGIGKKPRAQKLRPAVRV